MTIVLCGGGSGGHITPLLAVARELRAIGGDDLKLVYVGEKRGKFSNIAEDSKLFDEYHYISAGKLRRYHNEPLVSKLLDFKTIYFNTRDIIRLLIGTFQSILLFQKLKPASVLLKGGYVCVPASIGAKFAKSYIVTHDSDALPGLSNRFAARFAKVHATGMPEEYYNYPKSSAVQVGLPVDERYRKYSVDEVRFLKEKFNIPINAKVLLVVGGSNGARRLNNWSLKASEELMSIYPDLYSIMVVGKGNLSQVQNKLLKPDQQNRLLAVEFTSELYHLAALADVIITRAGATTLAEFAASSKACVLVPNPDLTGGHQLKNAKVYNDQSSVIVVQEKDIKKSDEYLVDAVDKLMKNPALRKDLGEKLNATLPKIPAAQSLANILLNGAKQS